MAKVNSIKLLNISESNASNTVYMTYGAEVQLEFHPIDIQLHMEYKLHLFLFDLKCNINFHALYPNWDQSDMVLKSRDSKKGLLGHFIFPLKAIEPSFVLEESLLVEMDKSILPTSAKLLAAMVPAVSYAAKWSNEYHMDVSLH
ncbi:MAG: hypothetical protein COA50_15540 [Flavobacteriaceae bacterium]|nr:MAG: hypothetical protein COA50_15540 [Flavobacteriaceae bacterium]